MKTIYCRETFLQDLSDLITDHFIEQVGMQALVTDLYNNGEDFRSTAEKIADGEFFDINNFFFDVMQQTIPHLQDRVEDFWDCYKQENKDEYSEYKRQEAHDEEQCFSAQYAELSGC